MKTFQISETGICPKCGSGSATSIQYQPAGVEYASSAQADASSTPPLVERPERMWVRCDRCSYQIAVSLDAGELE